MLSEFLTRLAEFGAAALQFAWPFAVAGFSFVTAGHALLHKRNPRPAAMWVVACLALPVVGAVGYWMFGFNRIWTRTEQTGARWPGCCSETDGEAAEQLDDEFSDSLASLSKIGLHITGCHPVGRNVIVPLRNGDEAYPPMLDAIRNAEQTVWLSTYIFDRDEVGLEFAHALGDAAKRGVDVRVLVDGLGEWYSPRRIGSVLLRSGVKVERFLAPSILPPSVHLNLRYHRKLLIVDGHVGFTGGMNIGKRHLVAARGDGHGTRDLHFRVIGPVVSQMDGLFREDWSFAQEEASWPAPDKKCREASSLTGSFVRSVSAGPNEDFEHLRWILLGVLSQARHRVRIMTPYFIAEPSLVAALNAGVLRGVEVELILPKRNNLPYMTWAARSQLWQILEFGVRVYEQDGAFSHTKLMLVDDEYALVGSSNLDPRSLRLNFEYNLEIFGGDCIGQLAAHFEDAKKESRELTLAQMDARPTWMRLRDACSALFSPYL